MANAEIREILRKKRIRHYEVAEQLGVSEYTFCKWLRSELPPDKREEVLEAIKKIAVTTTYRPQRRQWPQTETVRR